MIKDFLGNQLKEGDIVMRAKFSSFTFHKIIRFTKNNIVISCKREVRSYNLTNKTYTYKIIIDSTEVNDIKNHNEVQYINHYRGMNLSLIKYNKIL